ncbi:hypothetical protein RFI_08909 [Reticulomyxa filosa]|uniref:Uncharacterized protein n=1 Tax=Reticulomyxa filosa TaxID=46433 RepID=X6NPK8_RETFI|nr:hypothetical protein RFI_08909 [Reticulomyxa filosa]|eukprot:ETO28225.1 hypothetical protein RFI_08909 [Reticulomyxa filosa]
MDQLTEDDNTTTLATQADVESEVACLLKKDITGLCHDYMSCHSNEDYAPSSLQAENESESNMVDGDNAHLPIFNPHQQTTASTKTSTKTGLANVTIQTEKSQSKEKNSQRSNIKTPSSIRLVTSFSLAANVFLFIVKVILFLYTFSLAVLASLVDSILDLFTQVVMYWAEKELARVSVNYPAVE